MARPLVTIVIATYNRAGYLCETLESALNQTYKPVEIIVVDDGSTDDTRGVVARYAPDVRYVWQENRERGAARNHGLRLARGEFVAFLDSDDLWMPDKLERDLDILGRRSDVGLVYSDVEMIDAQGRPSGLRPRPHYDGWVTQHLLRGNFIFFSAHLARSQAIRNVGGFREERELAGSEDWELWVRLSTRYKFAHSATPTTQYRRHIRNSTSDTAAMERSLQHACAVIESANYLSTDLRSSIPLMHAMAELTSAVGYCVAGDQARARSRLLRAMQYSTAALWDPRFPHTCLHSLLTPALSARLRELKQKVVARLKQR